MLRLVVYHGSEEQVFAVSDAEAILGSAPESDLVVSAPGVSRRHATVRRVTGGIEVVDLGSKNGLYAEGRRVERIILSPGGLRIQAGTAWLEIEELSSSQESLVQLLHRGASGDNAHSPLTVTVDSGGNLLERSPADACLELACHVAQVGAGLPGARVNLLLRVKDVLGAAAFGSFERTRRGKLLLWETAGEFMPEDTNALAALVADAPISSPEQVVLMRQGQFLLAGRGAWFLGATFADESLVREGWRRDFLRFLAHQFFLPVRSLDDLNSTEAARILALAKGNKRKAALLLGVSRGTLYRLLTRYGTPQKRW
jgi:hypothetical protein